MKGLLEKAKSYLNLTTQKIGKLDGAIKMIIIGFFAIVVILVATFYAAWLYLLLKGKAMLGDLLNLIDRAISPQMVAFVAFIATSFVDQDNDGIPDKFENEIEKEKRGDKR